MLDWLRSMLGPPASQPPTDTVAARRLERAAEMDRRIEWAAKAVEMAKGHSRAEQLMGRMAAPYSGLSYLAYGWRDNRINQVRHFVGWTYVAAHTIAKLIAQQQPLCSVVRKAQDTEGPRHKRVGRPSCRYKYPLYRQAWFNRSAHSSIRGHDDAALKALSSIRPHEDLEPLDENHRLMQLLHKPNAEDTPFDLWYETILFLTLTGSSYWWTPRDEGFGLPTQIWCLPAHWVWPVMGDDHVIREYELRPVYGGYGVYRFPARDVIHLRYKSPVSKIDGYSAQTAGSRWIDQSESLDEARRSSFKNGSVPGVAVELPMDMVDPAQADLDRIEAKWINKFARENNYHRPVFLSAGMKVTPLTVSPREMDFAQTADQIRDHVLALFGVSKVIAGITEEVNFASMAAAQAGMCRYCLNPILSMIDQTLTEKFASQFDSRIRVWHMDASPDDPAQKLSENMAYLDRGVKSINEVRVELGLDPYPHGGDDPMMNPSLVPMPFATGSDLDLSAIAEAVQTMHAAQAGQGEGQPAAGPPGTVAPPGAEPRERPGETPAAPQAPEPAKLESALKASRNGHNRIKSELDWSVGKSAARRMNGFLNGRKAA